jgi:hypothetical protein
MNDLLTRLRNRFQRRELELEIEEELHLHIELLLRENIQHGMSPEEARAATLKRFGDFDGVKNECVEIRRRSRPLRRGLKLCAVLLALTGLILRISSTDLHVDHIGDLLIAIAVLGRLFLFVRSLRPSRYLPINKTAPLFTGDPQSPAS